MDYQMIPWLLLAGAGLTIVLLIRQWRGAERRHRTSETLAEARAERLAAVVNTGTQQGLSARVKLEEQLRASEARWRSVVESAVDAIVVIDARGHIEAFNPAAVRLFGHAETEVIGRNVSMLMPSPYHEEHDNYLAHYLSTGKAKIIGIGREVTGLRKDGTRFPLHLSVGAMELEGEQKFTGILHDLSERVKMEDQLREQASLVKLGEMAAVIAHEVKNPLAGVRGAIEIIGKRLPAGSPEASVVGEVIGRIDALNRLMQDMLTFARPPEPKLTQVDVTSLLAATVDLLRSDPAWGDVRVEVTGSAPLVSADGGLLRIVFLNLLVNAAHAVQGRGLIQVDVQHVDRMCRIRFIDAGPGISADIRERIFTPFFTTKSRGTGLGLPTVKRLVEAHRGTVGVESPSDGGTVVTVALPLGS
jgi:two-component system, LuxR family, sensor kinase FixL